MMMSSFCIFGARSLTALSTAAAGTISQIGARRFELRDEVVERRSAGGALAGELLDGVRAAVVHDAGVAVLHEAPDHVGAHAPEADHSELHRSSFRRSRRGGEFFHSGLTHKMKLRERIGLTEARAEREAA